jgi:two-component system phosphate regulon response regulator PhoB
MSSHLPPNIAIVTDDIIVQKLCAKALERAGLRVTKASNGEALLKLFDLTTDIPNSVVISEDLLNSKLCEQIKAKRSHLPIIVMADEHSITTLENVYDDRLLHPVDYVELVAKVQFVLSNFKPVLIPKLLKFDDIAIDLGSYKITKNGIEIHLGPTEFQILKCLLENPTKVFSREDIMYYVWQSSDNVKMRTIDVHINRLRSALKQPRLGGTTIKTVRSTGYCLAREPIAVPA